MRTVPEVVADLVRESTFLEEGLARGLINGSALARELRPAVVRDLQKPVGEAAVVMALNRLARRLKNEPVARQLFRGRPGFMVRSSLVEVTCANSDTLPRKVERLLGSTTPERNRFFTFTQGIFETTIIASRNLEGELLLALAGEKILSHLQDLSSLTIQLPEGSHLVPGLYSRLLRALAWEGINLVEVVSTLNEFNLILENGCIDRAFSVLKKLFDARP